MTTASIATASRRPAKLMLLALLAGAGACEPPSSQPPGSASTSGAGSTAAVPTHPMEPPVAPEVAAPAKKPIVPPVAAESAPAASPRLGPGAAVDKLQLDVDTYFEGHASHRIYLQMDKPLYKPGETIWFKSWDLEARSLSGEASWGAAVGRASMLNLQARMQAGGLAPGINYQLISPKGAVVLQKEARETAGTANGDFEIPAEVQGGEYTLKAIAARGVTGERPVIISTYEAPRLKMKLEFVRKAYGEGDEVTATFDVKRNTGEPLAHKAVSADIRLDGQDLPKAKLTTNAEGSGLVRFTLPKSIQVGDGLLTALVEDGGITESVSKRIPIIVHKLQFVTFPEGGKMIQGLPTRLYFEAKTPLGKPADVEGQIVDDVGNAVAKFQSYKDGLGRVEFTPATGRKYHAVISKPVGVTEPYSLPLALSAGCALRSFDDLDGQLPALRVSVRCSQAKRLFVAETLRENLVDVAPIEVKADEPAVVYLESKDAALSKAQGVARVTLFDENYNPLAERLVFRNRRSLLNVKVEPDKKRYTPRGPVSLKVTTTDPSGAPVSAELALSVVDDTVVSFADDKTGHLLSRLMLEPEIPGKVEEPNTYFDLTEAKSALAMDLLMGTRGWRTFEWKPVFSPPQPVVNTLGIGALSSLDATRGPALIGNLGALNRRGAANMEQMQGFGAGLIGAKGGGVALRGAGGPPPPPRHEPPPAPGRMAMAPQPHLVAAAPMPPKAAPAPAMVARPMANKPMMPQAMEPMPADPAREADQPPMPKIAQDRDWAEAAKHEKKEEMKEKQDKAMAKKAPFRGVKFAPVRVFPVPSYIGEVVGPRTDFRETIFWAPSVRTDANGSAQVSFPTSDAITSFRVFSEGVGRGLAGRDETVIASSLPFSMAVKLPSEVSAGDVLNLPLTLSNEEDQELDVTVDSNFGELLSLQGDPAKGGALAARSRKTLFFPVQVTGTQGESEIRFAARTGGLSDEFTRPVTVTRLGFPQVISRSGKAKGTVRQEVDLGEAIPGSADVTLKLYPSPVATMVSGLEGMLREPSGCFEQTSSTNYPNVMVMSYLRSHQVADAELTTRSGQLLESGYRRLTGYESPSKGYEWFGGDPGHEALTAYGLVEFMDMKRVYGNVDEEMVARTVRWLEGRRDGQGGYKRDAKALDSFGRADPAVTDAYITWALVRAGQTQLQPEIARSAKLALETSDAYRLALAANTLLRIPARKAEGQAAAARLAGLQEEDGSWKKEDHSITRSGGSNLWIETTSLSVLALLESGGHEAQVRKAVEWLQANRGGFGQWGATQATVLALQAMTAFDESNRKTDAPGTVSIKVNGEPAGEIAYEAGRRKPITFPGIGSKLTAGKNVIEITQSGGEGLPYSMAVEFRSLKPATSPDSPVDLRTSLERSLLKMGESVRLDASVTNKTAKGLPMTLARVGLPGGLTFQTWQLKELREKGLIAFYETRAREVILYFRDLKPGEVKQVPLDLVAYVPGKFTGPASSAYLYYNDTHKTWTDALSAQIDP